MATLQVENVDTARNQNDSPKDRVADPIHVLTKVCSISVISVWKFCTLYTVLIEIYRLSYKQTFYNS